MPTQDLRPCANMLNLGPNPLYITFLRQPLIVGEGSAYMISKMIPSNQLTLAYKLGFEFLINFLATFVLDRVL